MNTTNNTIEVEINLTLLCQQTRLGETVKVTGNTRELGNWDPIKAIGLKTGPTEFPKWKGTIMIAPNQVGKLEYKYVILREIDSHVIQWEPFNGNRIIDLTNLEKANVEDLYGQSQHILCDLKLQSPTVLPTMQYDSSSRAKADFDVEESKDQVKSEQQALPEVQLISPSIIHAIIKQDEFLSPDQSSSDNLYQKQFKKVKQVTNIVEKYNLVKKHKALGPSTHKQNPTGPSFITTPRTLDASGQVISYFDKHSALATAGDDDPTSFVIKQMTKLKRQFSNEITQDVDNEENRLIHSIEDMERHKLAKTLLTHKKELQEEVKDKGSFCSPDRNGTGVDDSDTTLQSDANRQITRSKIEEYYQRHHHEAPPGGTTGGVISSEEEEDEEDLEEDDDDLNFEDKRLLEDVKITATDIVIVASFKLPITVVRDQGTWEVRKSRSLLYPTMFKLREKRKMVKIIWIGWPGVIPQNEREAQEITEVLKNYGCVPVFFDQETIKEFLYFHETVLRPLFHNFKGLNDFEYDLGRQELWQRYGEVNSAFAKCITELKQDKEMVWIHDNYLLLVPSYVRRKDLNANIGFFMHSPFPSSDIYKMFPYRNEVLKSLLFCDLIGFHLFEYARNFYTTCRRMLGLNHEFKKGGFLGIECFGRNVMLRISHIGIQVEDIVTAMQTETYKNFVKQLQTHFSQSASGKRRQIISSIDRFHPISGLKNKLLAYQKFLRDYPHYRTQACLVQYVVVSEGQHHLNNEYTQTRSEILQLIREIEEEFGRGAIHYQEQDLLMEQRLALWAVSNILLITTLRDGQCLPPLEYITVKKLMNKNSKAAVILSEFSGCNRALGGILKINPYNVDEITQNIHTAINMPPEEKEQRMKIGYSYISRHSTYGWAESFLKDLKRSHQPCENEGSSGGAVPVGYLGAGGGNLMVGGSSTTDIGMSYKYMTLGFGFNLTLIKTRQAFQQIKPTQVEQSYKRSINRLIIFDQDEVLPMKGQASTGDRACTLEPYPHVLHALNELTKDDRNSVFVISSNTKDKMHKWYAEACPKLGLAAENGFFWRFDSQGKTEHDWGKLIKINDFCWIESVKEIMQTYTEKTDGPFIEQKESMIVWNYRDTDAEFGNWQAKELTSHLEHVFCNLSIEVIHNKKQLEVVPMQVKKQKLVKDIVTLLGKRFPLDFIMYIGEDSGNEPVFNYLNSRKQKLSKYLSGNASVFTCTIGRRTTQAKYFLEDSPSVIQMLEAMVTYSAIPRKILSQIEMVHGMSRLRNNSGIMQMQLQQNNANVNNTRTDYAKSQIFQNTFASRRLAQTINVHQQQQQDSRGATLNNHQNSSGELGKKNSGILFQKADVMAKINREEPEGEGVTDDDMSLNSGGNNSFEHEFQAAHHHAKIIKKKHTLLAAHKKAKK